MTTDQGAHRPEHIFAEFQLLDDASKALHGYFLHTQFHNYLSFLSENLMRWQEIGLLGADGEANPEADYMLHLDPRALDLEKMTYAVGTYLHVMFSHKAANYSLMHLPERSRVLYLRGYDYEGAVDTGTGMGVSHSSVDTSRFTSSVADYLTNDHHVFKVLSPKDLYWETVATQSYFNGDLHALTRACGGPIRSLYLSGTKWRDDIQALTTQMDHFVVYVSSITASVTWELDMLDRLGRTDDTTVVFDIDAIDNKTLHEGLAESVGKRMENPVSWPSARGIAPKTAEEFRAALAEKYTVIDPESLEDESKAITAKIESRTRQPHMHRDRPVPFRFSPGLDAAGCAVLELLDSTITSRIADTIDTKQITNVPWLINVVQLKLFIALLFGKHGDAGRALRVYSTLIAQSIEPFIESLDRADADTLAALRNDLENHADYAQHVAPMLVASHGTTEFDDYSADAVAELEGLARRTELAIANYFVTATQQ